MAITFNSPFSDYYKGVADSFKGVTFNPVTPAVINTTKNFLQSGSKNQGPHANNPGGVTPVQTYPLGTTKGDEYLTPKEPNLFVNNSDVPSLSEGLPVYGPLNQYGLMGKSSLGPITVGLNSYDPSTFANDNSPMNEAAGYPNYYKPTEQINPAGVTSADGMMTEPAMYLYPGEAIGIDGVPYRPSAGASTANSGSGGNKGNSSNSAGSYPVSNVLNTRTFPFTSRTPSGSVYTPDLSAYNDSSLFNYEGPGGVPEYTYGQGLRTDGADYSIFGSPADAANPYFAGQFATPAGPADAAINMPAVELPSGVQPISADVSMPGFTSGNQIIGGSLPSDLTYQQTIDEMGIFGPNNPPPSTTFPSPGSSTPEGLTNSGGGGRAVVPWINSKTGETFYAPHTGFKANNGDWKIASTMDNQLQQGQINKNREIANIASSPDTSMMDNQAAANLAMGDRMGYPSTVPTAQQTMDMLQARANQVYDNMTAEEKRDGLFIEPTYSVSKDTMKLGIPDIFATNNENVSSTGNLINRTPPERNIFKADEIDIPTPPFRPEGIEGEDFYQDVTGDYFAMEDDLGTQPLKPVSEVLPLSSLATQDFSEDIGTNSIGSFIYGNDQRTSSDQKRLFEEFRPKTDLSSLATQDFSEFTEAELASDTGELTSGDMGALNDAMTAIDAKYAGSKTDASAEAELKEILNATLNAFGGSGSTNARGAKGETVPADIPAFLNQDISRMADKYVPSPAESDYPPAYQSYAREDEGTSTGESLFQNVAEDIPLSVFNPIDRVVMQAEAQAAQVAAAQAQAAAQARAAVEAEARRNPPPPPPRVTVNYNRNKPTPVVKSKPTPRGPQPFKPTRTTGSRGGRGNVSASRRLTGGR
jgi:hypothetical protein